ncbi:ubiquitin C-terminal hydrolase [Gymnopilus dilepis]|uniref:ubiquitinyl hydrolase 1 n=1 Tax=Gymnopilus dilepis TaxID=231916 RepID=A0A409VXA4_9AGAR|nr:ubiquitin C-terminal hydrolase [Gymnopilus dilepis]
MDLVGGPFAVIESDPGVFTSLTRNLGIDGLELVEMYDIEPWAVDHLNPHGLIFCFMWRKDTHRPADFDDPSAERVWFANQLSDDACATHAILNVVLNCPGIEIGDELRRFREDTKDMSPVMRGLAITNSPTIRTAHNNLARPSDLRASLNNITLTTLDAEKKKKKELERKAAQQSQPRDGDKPPPSKRARTGSGPKSPSKSPKKKPIRRRKPKPKDTDSEDPSDESDSEADSSKEEDAEEETYHFIGYVPAYGKVWELDGLKSGPLEVGELPTNLNSGAPSTSASASTSTANSTTNTTNTNSAWMDVVRPALRLKMEKYGGSGNDGSNIRFSLLAIVDDAYRKASDELEWCKREKERLERRLDELAGPGAGGWRGKVDPSLLELSSSDTFSRRSRVYAPGFGFRRQERDIEISNICSSEELIKAWETCIRDATRAKVGVEDEVVKAERANTDHIKRTFDYEPFIREFLRSLHKEGLLFPLLDRDADGRKKKAGKKKAAEAGGGAGAGGGTGAGARAGAGAGGGPGGGGGAEGDGKAETKGKKAAKPKSRGKAGAKVKG